MDSEFPNFNNIHKLHLQAQARTSQIRLRLDCMNRLINPQEIHGMYQVTPPLLYVLSPVAHSAGREVVG